MGGCLHYYRIWNRRRCAGYALHCGEKRTAGFVSDSACRVRGQLAAAYDDCRRGAEGGRRNAVCVGVVPVSVPWKGEKCADHAVFCPDGFRACDQSDGLCDRCGGSAGRICTRAAFCRKADFLCGGGRRCGVRPESCWHLGKICGGGDLSSGRCAGGGVLSGARASAAHESRDGGGHALLLFHGDAFLRGIFLNSPGGGGPRRG